MGLLSHELILVAIVNCRTQEWMDPIQQGSSILRFECALQGNMAVLMTSAIVLCQVFLFDPSPTSHPSLKSQMRFRFKTILHENRTLLRRGFLYSAGVSDFKVKSSPSTCNSALLRRLRIFKGLVSAIKFMPFTCVLNTIPNRDINNIPFTKAADFLSTWQDLTCWL